ncbi:MAG: helix-turn-helix domain-containing protein [Thermodesulfobacteriota bacterium]
MTRPLRLAFEDACYHITSRGNRKDNIFIDNADKEMFIRKLNETLNKFSIVCYAYCLMHNHYHLFIKTPKGNISSAMHNLNTSYTNWFKARHQIVGVVFQGRYKSLLVDEDSYALQLSTYIHLNPVRAGMVEKPEEYIWSSYLDYMGKRRTLENMDTDLVLSSFGNDNKKAINKYKSFLKENMDIDNPMNNTYKSVAVGSEKYLKRIEEMISGIGKNREIKETKNLQKISPEKIIKIISNKFGLNEKEVISKKRGNIYRQLAIYIVKISTDLSLKEIGETFNMDYSDVSQTCRRLEDKIGKDRKLSRLKESIVNEIKMSNVETRPLICL